MATSEVDLIREFTEWLKPLRGTYANYYVGVAANPKDRLLSGHGLDDKGGRDTWRYDTASSASVARRVEAHFLASGMKGGPGGGDASSLGVYIYRISTHSRE